MIGHPVNKRSSLPARWLRKRNGGVFDTAVYYPAISDIHVAVSFFVFVRELLRVFLCWELFGARGTAAAGRSAAHLLQGIAVCVRTRRGSCDFLPIPSSMLLLRYMSVNGRGCADY